jgi:hypothetical protein
METVLAFKVSMTMTFDPATQKNIKGQSLAKTNVHLKFEGRGPMD